MIKRYTPKQILEAGMTVITAHSGCENTEANSLEHIIAGLSSGAEMIEVDIRDDGGRLYLSHDLPDDPSGKVALDTLFELLSHNPTIRVNCDLKTDGLIAPVMACAKKHNVTSQIVFTGSANSEQHLITTLGGELWYSLWNSDHEQEEILETEKICRDIGCEYINLQYKMVNEENTKRLKANGLRFSVWTADNEKEIRRLLGLGISNITTRHPVLALNLRDEIQGTPESHGILPEAQIENTLRAAGKMMLCEYDGIDSIGVKVKPGESNFVTETDIKIQRFLEKRLTELVPDAEFLAEEEGQDENSLGDGFVFVIDPIDGTTNYMHDYARSVVSVALLKNREPVFGAVYDPYLNEYYSAVKGKGAYCNGKRICVDNCPADRALVSIGTSPYDVGELGKRSCDIIYSCLKEFADIRRQGSAVLEMMYVARGRSNAYTELNICPWDYSAGAIIASEAGAVISDAEGNPLVFGKKTSVIFSSPNIYDKILDIVKKTK